MAYDYTAAGAYVKAEPYARNVRDKIGDTFLAIPGTIQENTEATFQSNKTTFEAEILADLEPTAVAAEVIAARAAYANLNARLNALVPAPGVVEMFAGATAPTGYLICDGAAISRTTYAALFAIIGTTYGAGNGSTTFNIPNLKGKVAVGRDASQTEFDVLGKVVEQKHMPLRFRNCLHALTHQPMMPCRALKVPVVIGCLIVLITAKVSDRHTTTYSHT